MPRPSATTLPHLGLGLAGHGQPLSPRELDRLRALRLDHLRVDLTLSGPDWEAALRRAWAEARALGGVDVGAELGGADRVLRPEELGPGAGSRRK